MTRLPSMDEARRELDAATTVSVYAAAVLLGCGEFSLRRAVDSGEVPALRFGRNVRIATATIRKLLDLPDAA